MVKASGSMDRTLHSNRPLIWGATAQAVAAGLGLEFIDNFATLDRNQAAPNDAVDSFFDERG